MFKLYYKASRLFFPNIILLGSITLTVWLPANLLSEVVESTSAQGLALQISAWASLFAPISAGALIYALSRIQAGAKPTYAEALATGFRNWFKLLVARYVANLLIGLGFIALVVPGIILLVRYSLLEIVVVVDGSGVNASRRRSFRLTSGLSWRIFFLGAVFVGVIGVLSSLGAVFYVAAGALLEAPVVIFASCMLNMAFAFFVTVLFVVFVEACGERGSAAEGDVRPLARNSESGREALAYGLAVVVVVALSFMPAFRSAVADWNDVPAGAMKPSILPGDRIVVNRMAYDLKVPFADSSLMRRSDPKWGDIVVFRSPEGALLVKRIIGLPGDVIEIRGDKLVRNGEPATYRALSPDSGEYADIGPPNATFYSEALGAREFPIMVLGTVRHPPGPFDVPEDQFFVMGDNRNNSRDSRYFGPIARSAILGQATAVALSLDRENHWKPRWSRFLIRLP